MAISSELIADLGYSGPQISVSRFEKDERQDLVADKYYKVTWRKSTYGNEGPNQVDLKPGEKGIFRAKKNGVYIFGAYLGGTSTLTSTPTATILAGNNIVAGRLGIAPKDIFLSLSGSCYLREGDEIYVNMTSDQTLKGALAESFISIVHIGI